MPRLTILCLATLFLASSIAGCDGEDEEALCDPVYDFEAGEWRGGEGSAPGGAGESDDEGYWDDDDATLDDDDATTDDDDAAWDDDDAADDDDSQPWSDDDDATADDDDATGDPWGDDDDSGVDDDDSAADDDDATETPTNDEERDEDAIDPVCLVDTSAPVTQFMSADDSNSMADPSQHREMILHHGRVPTRAKPWEYLNYFDFEYPAAREGTLRIVPELAARPGRPGEFDLLVGVVAPGETPTNRAPFNLVFSLDVSGSMSGAGMDLMKSSLRAIAASLKAGDFVSVVLWSATNSVVLQHHPVQGPDDADFLDVIEGLIAGGSTNLDGGLAAAYDLAVSEPIHGTTNRVVLISDGGANVGQTTASRIAEHAQDGEDAQVYLVGIGVPPANEYDDALMDQVTDLGRGAYLYVDSDCEAQKQFTAHTMSRVFGVAALDVRLEMTLPSGLRVHRFSGEQISYEAAEVVPQHLAPNDQMLFDIDLIDCSGAAEFSTSPVEFRVEWTDPATGQARVDTVSLSMPELLEGGRENERKAQAIVAFARSFRHVQNLQTAYEQVQFLEEMSEYLAGTRARLNDDIDLMELERLVNAWRAMY